MRHVQDAAPAEMRDRAVQPTVKYSAGPARGEKVANGEDHALRRMPALDGIRGLAVLAVLFYHGAVKETPGGFLGVEAFFVLSGFLITSLLIREWARTGSIRLRAFWGRRARRLLPALLCVVAAVGIQQVLVGPQGAVPGLLPAGLATLFYVGNWQQIVTGTNYFTTGAPVSPLQHTWSLAIEEQFYIVWPLLLLGVLWLTRHHTTLRLRVGLALSLLGALLSGLLMGLLYAGGQGLNRVYLGTDTRAQGLLIGCALAFLLALVDGRSPGKPMRWSLATAAGIAALMLAVAVNRAHGSSAWLFSGGMLGIDLLVACVIGAAVLLAAAPTTRILAWAPLRGLGLISYGLYLWHYPLFLWLTNETTGLSGHWLLLLRLAASLGVALVSYWVIEQPIRQRRLPRPALRLAWSTTATAAVAALLAGSLAGQAVTVVPPPVEPAAARYTGGQSCSVPLTDTATAITVPPTPGEGGPTPIPQPTQYHNSATLTFHTCPPVRVLVIGDSLSATLGVGLLTTEQKYGVEVMVDPLPGCGYGTVGQFDLSVGWQDQPPECPGEIAKWRQDIVSLHAQAVVVEMGWRDSFDRMWNGQVVHLGQPGYDAYVEQRMQALASTLGQGGIPVTLLGVPWSNPPAQADGSEPPVATPARHNLINQLLQKAAAATGATYFSIDPYIAPGGHYEATVEGQLCRYSDGLHFTPFCGALIGQYLLPSVRQQVAAGPGAAAAGAASGERRR